MNIVNLAPSTSILNYKTNQIALNNYQSRPTTYSFENDVFIRNNSSQVSFGDSNGVKHYLHKLRKHHSDLLQHTDISVEKWLKQFENNKDKCMALKLLSNFEYYSQDDARNIFGKIHKQLLEKSGFDINKTAFTYLGDAKSGSVMGYFYSQGAKFREKGPVYKGNDLNQKMFALPKLEQMGVFNQDSKINTIVIVDDMIDNGNSLKEFLSPELTENLKNMDKVYFVSLLKNPEGAEKIKELLPNIEFISHKNIYKYDSPECTKFSKKDKHEIKQFLHKYSKKIEPKEVQKFQNSRIFVAFDWNTPGNTPMPFCYNKPGVWEPLFRRYNGLM